MGIDLIEKGLAFRIIYCFKSIHFVFVCVFCLCEFVI